MAKKVQEAETSPEAKVPINLKARKVFRDRLKITAKVLDVPYRQIIIDGTEEKIERLASKKPELKRALEAA